MNENDEARRVAEDWFAALCPVPGKSVPLKYLPKFKPEKLYANREKLSMSARQAAALAASAISNRVVLEPGAILPRRLSRKGFQFTMENGIGRDILSSGMATLSSDQTGAEEFGLTSTGFDYLLDSLDQNILEPVFIAHRNDGLGARLGAMVSAMMLAELTDVGFRLVWPQIRRSMNGFHPVTDAGEIFAGDFLQAHLIAQEDFDESWPVALDDEVVGALRQGRIAPGTMISVQTRHVLNRPIKRLLGVESVGPRMAEAFARIGFSAPMEEARAMAAGAALPAVDVTAIHLRAGDIVYGINRKRDPFHGKVIPYPLAIDLIARLRAVGVTPLLFGEDADLLAHLRDEHGAYSAHDIGDRSGFSPDQNALFDICLLGRCRRIFAGNGGAFARLGAAVAGIEVEPPESLYEADEAVGIIERHLFDPDASPLISGKQKAFAVRYAFVLAGERIARDERFWRLLELARENDPENSFLQFVYACSLYDAGKASAAETMLSDGLNSGISTLYFLLRTTSKTVQWGTPCAPYMDALAAQARAGHPVAALCCAIHFTATRQDDRAERMVAILGRVSDPEIRRVAARLLPQLSSQAAPNAIPKYPTKDKTHE